MKKLNELILRQTGIEQKNVMSNKELQQITGGYADGWCVYICTCQGSGGSTQITQSCSSGGPWDRNPNCGSGYQDCEQTYSY